MERLLLVEDADTLREVLVSFLESKGYEVDAYPSCEEALPAVFSSSYDCILADFKLPGKNGLELLRETREHAPKTPFLIMTAFGSIDISVEAMKLGANDFLTKPFEPELLLRVIEDVVQHRQITDRALGLSSRRARSFLTHNERTKELLYQVRRAARVLSPILISGESGTGKELIARYIHAHSPRADCPFVAINCAALPEELLESELFGHEEGAFTGATQTRRGVFELAAEGTIFLDEIADMEPHLQVKLLRALQEGEIKRIGSNASIRANPRVVAATNRDIQACLESGELREDFYYRIAVVEVFVPPLRERPEDIDLLADHYIKSFCQSASRKLLKLSPEARKLLHAYRWPGNARELENVIERAVILAQEEIQTQHLGIHPTLDFDSLQDTAATLTEIGQGAARRAEEDAIKKALSSTRGNKTKAAKMLGVSYKTLLNKVKEYELSA